MKIEEDVNSYSDACQFSSFLFASIALRQRCVKIHAGLVGLGSRILRGPTLSALKIS